MVQEQIKIWSWMQTSVCAPIQNGETVLFICVGVYWFDDDCTYQLVVMYVKQNAYSRRNVASTE